MKEINGKSANESSPVLSGDRDEAGTKPLLGEREVTEQGGQGDAMAAFLGEFVTWATVMGDSVAAGASARMSLFGVIAFAEIKMLHAAHAAGILTDAQYQSTLLFACEMAKRNSETANSAAAISDGLIWGLNEVLTPEELAALSAGGSDPKGGE